MPSASPSRGRSVHSGFKDSGHRRESDSAARAAQYPRRSLVILLAALGAAAVAVWELRQPWAKGLPAPWILLVAGMGVAAWALTTIEPWFPGRAGVTHPASIPSPRRRLVGKVLLVLALIITALIVLYLWPDYNKWQGSPLFWITALALTIAGAWLVGVAGQVSPRASTRIMLWRDTPLARWLEVAAFVLILALAVFLRTYRLDSIPPGIYVDETNAGLDALHILEGRPDSPFATGWYETPNGYLYYMALIFRIFGATWLGLKMASLIPAILTVPAVYWLAREAFGPLTAICAMLLMAVSRWHLSLSRWGWNETAPPLFQVLAVVFLLRGLRRRSALDYALSGMLTALAVYIYLSSRLAALTIGVYIIYWFVSDPVGPRLSLRRSWRGIVLLLIAAIITVAPIAVTYLSNPFAFGNRVSEISVFRDIREQGTLTPLLLNLTDILKFFHQTGDLQGKHNLPGEPMMDPVTGLFFAVGVAYALFRWRDHRNVLLLLWIVIGLAGSYLSSHHESPQSYRSLTALPGAIILAADALTRCALALYAAVRSSVARPRRSALPAALAGIVLFGSLSGAGMWESSVYFGRQASSIAVIRGFNPTENQVAHETIAALQAGKTVYLSPNFSEFSPLRFLLYGVYKSEYGINTLDRRPYHLLTPEVGLPLAADGKSAQVLLDTQYWPLLSYFESFYPQAQMELVKLADDSPLYMRMMVTADQIAGLQGLEQKWIFSDGHSESQVVPQLAAPRIPADVTLATWDGAIRIDQGGEYSIGGSGGLQLAVDARPWPGTGYLGRGLYRLHLSWLNASDAASPRLTWQPPGATVAEIPPEVLYHISTPLRGLLGSYYRNTDWQGEPVFQQLTPFLLLEWPGDSPVGPNGPFSARYTGALRIPQSGAYDFMVQADDGARVILDGNTVGEGLVPNQPNNFSMTLQLQAGDHPLQIDYVQFGGGSALRLFWRQGGQPWTPVPPSALIPPSQ